MTNFHNQFCAPPFPPLVGIIMHSPPGEAAHFQFCTRKLYNLYFCNGAGAFLDSFHFLAVWTFDFILIAVAFCFHFYDPRLFPRLCGDPWKWLRKNMPDQNAVWLELRAFGQ